MPHAFWITSSCYRVLGRCPWWQARGMSWSRTSWRAVSRSCSEVSVWCQTFTRVPIESNFYNTCPIQYRVPIESNFYNTCPMYMKLNQSGQDMSLPVVTQFWWNPKGDKKVTFKFTFLVLSSLNVIVPFCHEDGGGELCKLYILIVVS